MPPKTTRKRKAPTDNAEVDEALARPLKQATVETVSKFFVPDLGSEYAARRARVSVPEAKKGIRSKANQVLDLVAQLDKGARDAQDGKSLAAGLSDITRRTTEGEPRGGIYEKARGCIAEFQQAVGRFEAMSKDTHGIQKPLGLRWAQDSQDLVELDRRAMAVSLRTLNGSVLAKRHGREFAPPAGGRDDLEMMAWEMLAEGRPDNVKETWGAAMQDLMVAFREVVKLLPGSQ